MKKIILIFLIFVVPAVLYSQTPEPATVFPTPTATFTSGDVEMCDGDTHDLMVQLTEGPSWTLVYTDGFTNYTVYPMTTSYTISVSPTSTTIYTLLSVSNANCSGEIIYGPPPSSGSVTVTVNPLPTFTFVDVDDVQCYGQNNGEATVNPTGGSLPFYALWDNGITTLDNHSLNAGLHDATVTDGNGCVNTGSVFIDEPNELVINLSLVENVTCSGGNTGMIVVSVSGGTGDYTYVWSHDPTLNSPVAPNLGVGFYSVTVTDENGCTDQLNNIQVVQDQPPVASLGTVTNATCYDSYTGSAEVVVTGGTPDYTYNWSNGQTSNPATGLHAGTYTCVVTDANGCTDQIQLTITEPSALSAELTTTNVGCDGSPLGTASLAVTGGTPGYSYEWVYNGLPFSYNSSVSNLQVGIYSVSATDANGCFAAITPSPTFTISQNPTPNASISVIVGSNPTCLGSEVMLQATGGQSYYWSTGETTDIITVNPLENTDYMVTVTNEYGCTDTETITVYVNEPPVVTFTPPAQVCQGSNIIILADYTTVNPYTGGTVVYIGSGVVAGRFYPETVAAGQTYDITASYFDPTTGCTATAVAYITVYGPPSVTLNLPVDNVCINDGAVALSGGIPSGGIYSGTGVNSSTSVFDPAIAGVGTHQIIYTFEDGYGCSASASDNIVVQEPVFVNLSVPANEWCTGKDMNVNVNIENAVVTANGLVLQQLDTYTFLFSPNTAGNYELIATAQSACSSSDTVYINVGESPVVTFTLPSEVLISDPPFQMDGAPAGGTYTVDGNISGITFDPAYWGSPGGSVDRLVRYEVLWGFCSDFIEYTITIVDPSSAIEDVEASLITIYPNPTSTFLNVDVGNADISEIQIMDAIGQVVYENSVNDDHLEISVNHLTDGIYFVRFVDGNGKFTYSLKKFIKTK